MRVSFGLIGILIVVAISAVPRSAAACSCIDPGPECQAFWKTDAVFDATVVRIAERRIEPTEKREFAAADLLVTLRVHRAWKGAQPGDIEVTTSRSGGTCGYDFREGERYLVFAHQWGGHLNVSMCSLTQPFDGSGTAAEFLSSLDRPATGGRVFGTVRTWQRVFEHDRPRPEVNTETTVRLTGAGKDWTTRSAGGQYEFSGLPDGTYTLDIDIPEGHRTYGPTRTIDIPNARACAEENFAFTPAGRIAGRLVGPDGKGLASVRVEVTLPDAKPHPTYGLSIESRSTDASGFFELGDLPPGRYIVGVNLRDLPNKYNPYGRIVYPGTGEPHVIELGLGQAVDLGTWFMPAPLPITRVEGIVMRADGTRVAGVHVGAWDDTGDPVERARGAGNTKSGSGGRFVLELRQGRVYTFMARDKRGRRLRIQAPQLETRDLSRIAIQVVVLDGGSKGPSGNNCTTLTADASRGAALLVASIRPVCALLAPCAAGASAPIDGALVSGRALTNVRVER